MDLADTQTHQRRERGGAATHEPPGAHSEGVGVASHGSRERLAVPRAGGHLPSIALFATTALVVIAADLWTKHVAFEYVAGRPITLTASPIANAQAVPDHRPIVLIPYILNLHLTTNPGAVFGLGKGSQWLFITISIGAVVLIAHFFYRSRAGAWPTHLALGLILAGALGNLYDRLRFGVVRDLLRLFPETNLWPWIFNVADAALVVGTSLILLIIWVADRHRHAG